jgi:hypothetical protein
MAAVMNGYHRSFRSGHSAATSPWCVGGNRDKAIPMARTEGCAFSAVYPEQRDSQQLVFLSQFHPEG